MTSGQVQKLRNNTKGDPGTVSFSRIFFFSQIQKKKEQLTRRKGSNVGRGTTSI